MYLSPQFGYSVDTILRYIHESPDCVLQSSSFPYDIKEYYWIQEGEFGNKSWYALGLLEENIYFFYKAYAHTAFDKGGSMDLWISYNFSDLIQYAMDTFTYMQYVTGTEGTTGSQGTTSGQGATSSQNKISDELTSDPLTNLSEHSQPLDTLTIQQYSQSKDTV
jgi:hypothetical protein